MSKKYISYAILFGLIIFGFIFSRNTTTANSKSNGRAFEFIYTVTIDSLANRANRVNIWVPIPQSNRFQEIKDVTINSPIPYSITTEKVYGNRMLFVQLSKNMPARLEMSLNLKVRRKLAKRNLWMSSVPISPDEKRKFLQPDSLVPIDGRIAEEAHKVVRAEMEPLQKARAIYDYLCRTMTYDKSGTGWGKGDALHACNARTGNCTDFHSLFIGMARAVGIPARFKIGFPIPASATEGVIPGYHCWAEFYVDGRGWIPVDVSEAAKHPDKREFFFGNLDADRIQFTIGRDIELVPRITLKRMNYFIYPYVLVDGRPYQSVKTRFYFRSLKDPMFSLTHSHKKVSPN